ncbi:MAG: antibiotic biosynthesis monooxygenase [Proteobacteria bacterium]|nr:antibiotic biosynthesis monooxygenase [Pseudomonadota bacterium]MDA1357478.1 antibiotic biosynthesis monooxygenase [Pseudomonadota bacterium]
MTDGAQHSDIFQVIGRFNLRSGTEATWDAAFRERIGEAASAPGWLGVASWVPVAHPSQRIVVGRWRATADFDAWTQTESYVRTKQILDSCQTSAPDIEWFRSASILDEAPAPG